MAESLAGEASEDDVGRSVVDALRAHPGGQQLGPPVASPMQLPSHQLSPPMFERLVAEFALRVDGLSRIRLYGRSGQSQGGLDLIGWDADGLTVYQVRRIESLSAEALRKAVTDFAEPTTKVGEPKTRRFPEARRFVLVTGCAVADTAVDDELTRLKHEYDGDLVVDLYDNTELSMRLRYHGPLVYGIFGPAWGEALCGYRPPPSAPPEAPDGRAYLADPIDILGLSDVRRRADDLVKDEPNAAAEVLGGLADDLAARGFTPRARQLLGVQQKVYRDAGRADKALAIAVELTIVDCEDGELFPGDRRQIAELVDEAGSGMVSLASVCEAIASWFERGYDLAPVVGNLTVLLDANAPQAVRLLRIVAEQVLADDDPRDDHGPLVELIARWQDSAVGLERVRLMCCVADFRVWSGTVPADAFAELARMAFAGHVDSGQAALIQRRCARARTDAVDVAVDHYRRAVLDASAADLGGDVREALRSLAYLAEFGDGVEPMDAARSVTDRAYILGGADRVVVRALEALAADKLPQALRSTHEWVRRERVNGALMDEAVALGHLGGVYSRAGEHASAARAYTRGGARKRAKRAAGESGTDYIDADRYLAPHQLVAVQEAAAACVASQADYIPDQQVGLLCTRLQELARGIGAERLFSSQASIEALRGLAAFGGRLPTSVGNALLDEVEPLIARPEGTYRFCDGAIIDLLVACARHTDSGLVERGVAGLVRCVGQNVRRADDRLQRLGRTDQATNLLLPMADDGNRSAIEILASWDVVSDSVRAQALAAARQLLEREVGQPRNVWTIGGSVQETAVQLRAALRSGPDDELSKVRDLLVEHLLVWAEDLYDVADSRAEPVHALRILSSELPSSTRGSAVDRLLAMHDDPRFSHMDEINQESLHALSRFRFESGITSFTADCLLAAAALTETDEQRHQVWIRIAAQLSDPAMNKSVAERLSRAMLTLSEQAPVDIRQIAGHSQALLRRAAVICWAADPNRDPAQARPFASDQDAVVRSNLAHIIGTLEPRDPGYDLIAEQLQHDPNEQVRRAARGSAGTAD